MNGQSWDKERAERVEKDEADSHRADRRRCTEASSGAARINVAATRSMILSLLASARDAACQTLLSTSINFAILARVFSAGRPHFQVLYVELIFDLTVRQTCPDCALPRQLVSRVGSEVEVEVPMADFSPGTFSWGGP